MKVSGDMASKPISLTTSQLRDCMAKSKKRRHEETRRARAQQEEAAMLREAQRERTFGRNPITYIGTIFISLLFLSLPLSEPKIDWSLIATLLTVLVLWNFLFHRHTSMHYVLFFLLNVLVSQFSEVILRIPEVLSRVSPWIYLSILVSNLAFGVVFYKLMRVRALTRTEYVDWAASGHICLNLFLAIVTGVIPAHAFIELARSCISVLFGSPDRF